jgi:hypothetical protein
MGILYSITCIETGEQYIGATTVKLGRRWSQHKYNLKRGVHHSGRLQRCADKWGVSSLECELLAYVDDTILDRVEQLVTEGMRPAMNGHYKLGRALAPASPVYRRYLVGDKYMTMPEVKSMYPCHVFKRVKNGETGNHAIRPRDPRGRKPHQ